MARLRILPLPGDGAPFAVVLDRADEYTIQLIAYGTTLESDGTQRPTRESLKDALGARAILVFEQDLDLSGDEPATAAQDLCDDLRARLKATSDAASEADTANFRVRTLHRRADYYGKKVCAECSRPSSALASVTVPWPCSTLQALDGTL